MSTALEMSRRSGDTSSNCVLSAMKAPPLVRYAWSDSNGFPRSASGGLGSHLTALFDCLFDGADHVEGALGQVVIVAFDDALEALDGVFELHELAGRSSEDFGDMEG